MQKINFTLGLFLLSNFIFGQKWIVPMSDIKSKIDIFSDAENVLCIYEQNDTIIINSGLSKNFFTGIDSLAFLSSSIFKAKKNKYWGLYDVDFHAFKIPPVYDDISLISDKNLLKVSKYGHDSTIDFSNNSIDFNPNTKTFKFKNGQWLSFSDKIQFGPGDSLLVKGLVPSDLRIFNNGYKWIKNSDTIPSWYIFDKDEKFVRNLNISNDFFKKDKNIVKIIREPEVAFLDFLGDTILPFDNYDKKNKYDERLLEKVGLKTDLLPLMDLDDSTDFWKKMTELILRQKKKRNINLDSLYSFKKYKKLLMISEKVKIHNKMIFYQDVDTLYLFEKNGRYNKQFTASWNALTAYSRFIIGTRDRKQALITEEGNFIFDFDMWSFQQDFQQFISVKKDVKILKYIDHNNKEYPPELFDFEYKEYLGKYTIIKKNGKFGVIDYELHQIIPCTYDLIEKSSSTKNCLILTSGKLKGVLSLN